MNELPNRDVVIFTEAVGLCADERAEYLERACGGDTTLRQRVEALLQTHDHVGDFLEESPQQARIEERVGGPASEKPGDRIGRYKLLQQIGVFSHAGPARGRESYRLKQLRGELVPSK